MTLNVSIKGGLTCALAFVVSSAMAMPVNTDPGEVPEHVELNAPQAVVKADLSTQQLEAIQTRTFDLAIADLATTIKALAKERSERCLFTTSDVKKAHQLEGVCRFKTQGVTTSEALTAGAASFLPFIGGLLGLGVQNTFYKNMLAQVTEIEFNIVAVNRHETSVRIRLYDMKGTQLDNPSLYAEEFQLMADALSVSPSAATSALNSSSHAQQQFSGSLQVIQ
jgi:hypothetical protein